MECCRDFAEVFDPIIQDYHGISKDAVHNSDMDVTKIKVCGNTENIRNIFNSWILMWVCIRKAAKWFILSLPKMAIKHFNMCAENLQY